MSDPSIVVRPIARNDAAAVSSFLHQHLNPRVAVEAWSRLLDPPWSAAAPNRGFCLVADDDRVLGAYVAVYSNRTDGTAVCNLAAFCVVEEHRSHAIRLVRTMTRQKGLVFTDLSPSGTVPAINERLGFTYLDTTTRLVLNSPGYVRHMSVIDDPRQIERVDLGADTEVFADHRDAPAARHLLLTSGNSYAYLMYRRDRRKQLPLFASPIYVGGDRDLLRRGWPAVSGRLLRRGLPVTLAERRVLGFEAPGAGRILRRPRAKMFRGPVDASTIDYLYSELTLLQW